MQNDVKYHILSLAIIVAAFSLAIALSISLDSTRPELPVTYADSDLALQGKKLRGYALGAEGLIADWYWIQSLQYLGGKIVNSNDETIRIDDLTSLNPRLLYPYLENATELDPKFTAAYSFGAVVLPGINVDKAIELTEKGIANNPDNWRLYQYLGYIYWKQKDYVLAADTYDRGSKIPGAPPFMRQMVASLNEAGGSRETARAIYEQMLKESEDEQSRTNAQLRLYELESKDEIEAIDRVLANYQQETGRCPTTLREINARLRDIRLPNNNDFQINAANELVDPTAIPYFFDRSKCTVTIDRSQSKVPVS
jgi:tetratricopeptide (TPR) repeat protein